MPFLVRKLNKRDQLSKLLDKENIEEIDADVPTNEFKTKNGTLSTWYIEDIDSLDNAVLACAVSSTEISKFDFIIMDIEILRNNGLDFKQTYAGMELPIPDLQNTHYDIVGVSLKKLANCAEVYKTIFSNENDDEDKYIVRYTKPEIKEILKEAIADKRVDKNKATGHILETIEKLSAS